MRAVLAILAFAVAPCAFAAESSVEAHYSRTFNDCMTAAAGSTLPMRDCIGAEHDAWDKSLNQAYQALMARRSPAQKAALRESERAWLRHEKARCDHAGDDEAGGSLQGVEIDQCYLDETIRRTLSLRSQP